VLSPARGKAIRWLGQNDGQELGCTKSGGGTTISKAIDAQLREKDLEKENPKPELGGAGRRTG